MNVREEVQGAIQTVRKCFLNYGPNYLRVSVTDEFADYAYDRTLNFTSLPAPSYIPAEDPEAGWFEYLGPETGGSFSIVEDSIMKVVFGMNGFQEVNVGGFTQAADDTREVIEFMHDHPLPVGYETPVPICDVPDQDTIYDLSISEQSGLQVPRQIVDGSEGREFTVAVANAGPDAASGSVIVTAVAANGGTIDGSPWKFPFTDLAGGESKSWVGPFSIDLGVRTTINWTATANPADCERCDLNMTNNTVTATSSVRVTSSGGSGRKP